MPIRRFCGSIEPRNFFARVVRFQMLRPQPDSPTRATSHATSGESSGCLPAVIQPTSNLNRKNVQDAKLLRPPTFSWHDARCSGENRMTFGKTFAPRSFLLLLFLSSFVATIPARADTTSTKDRTVTKLADNIYEIRHPDAQIHFLKATPPSSSVRRT